jgi:hypothetical protein
MKSGKLSMSRALCIFSKPEELDQGLFGNAIYHACQLLPYLYEQQIFPAWELRTLHYGEAPDFVTIPGALDLAYEPPTGPYRYLSLEEMRRRHASILGGSWQRLHHIWNSYFRIPPRVLASADEIAPRGRVLGIHYRGTDKQTESWDSNPISQTQYLALIADFLSQRSEFDVIFAATDEFAFVEKLRSFVSLPVVALGAVDFHLATGGTTAKSEKTDRAVLDCVLLSRCDCVIETSSALPSFAKLLNPDLEIYRCAASKLFGKLYSDMPYFPVAFIPMLPVTTQQSRDILEQTMFSDWSYDARMDKYKGGFVSAPRWPLNNTVIHFADKFGVGDIAAKLLRGHQ